MPGVIDFRKPKVDYNNIAPRVGFAFDPFGTGRTSIRGGFGISYDVKFQNFASITLPPQLQSELNEDAACTLTPQPSWCATGTGFLAGGGLPQTYIPPATQSDARALTSSFIDDTVMPKILTWSLGVQHQVLRNSSLEVRYLGTRGLELPVQYRVNLNSYFDAGGAALPTYLDPSSIPATFNASTPTDTAFYNFDPNRFASYGFLANVTGDPPFGDSVYHSGSVSFTHRLAHSFTLNSSYTYSHTIDTGTNEFFTSFLNPRRAQDTNHLANDRGSSDLDVRHKFSLAWSWELPKMHAESGLLKALLNGYQIGSVFLAQSGQPVTLQSGLDTNGNGDSAGDRVVLNPAGVGLAGTDVFAVCEATPGTTASAAVGSTYIASTSFLNAATNGCANNPLATSGFGFDPAIGYAPVNSSARYVLAAFGTRTTVGRNSFRSPGFGVLNLSVFKNMYFGESRYLQLRADVFNVLNHPNYSLSNGNVFSNAGVTTATSVPGYVQVSDPDFLSPKLFSGGIRTMTLGAKIIF